MTLSDACFEFLEAVRVAAGELAEAVHWYSTPDAPIPYGEEIDALRRACLAMVDSPYDAETGAQLLRLAESVMRYHDTPPAPLKSLEHQAKVKTLVGLLQSGVDPLDTSAIPYIVEHLVSETPFTERAVKRLRAILPTLAQPIYDKVADIIDDVGSATVKKELGLLSKATMNSKVQADIGILTIKDEELDAVLDVFRDGSRVYISPSTHRHYNLRIAEAGDGTTYQVAIIRQPEQGNGEAQSAARDPPGYCDTLQQEALLEVSPDQQVKTILWDTKYLHAVSPWNGPRLCGHLTFFSGTRYDQYGLDDSLNLHPNGTFQGDDGTGGTYLLRNSTLKLMDANGKVRFSFIGVLGRPSGGADDTWLILVGNDVYEGRLV